MVVDMFIISRARRIQGKVRFEIFQAEIKRLIQFLAQNFEVLQKTIL